MVLVTGSVFLRLCQGIQCVSRSMLTYPRRRPRRGQAWPWIALALLAEQRQIRVYRGCTFPRLDGWLND